MPRRITRNHKNHKIHENQQKKRKVLPPLRHHHCNPTYHPTPNTPKTAFLYLCKCTPYKNRTVAKSLLPPHPSPPPNPPNPPPPIHTFHNHKNKYPPIKQYIQKYIPSIPSHHKNKYLETSFSGPAKPKKPLANAIEENEVIVIHSSTHLYLLPRQSIIHPRHVNHEKATTFTFLPII